MCIFLEIDLFYTNTYQMFRCDHFLIQVVAIKSQASQFYFFSNSIMIIILSGKCIFLDVDLLYMNMCQAFMSCVIVYNFINFVAIEF